MKNKKQKQKQTKKKITVKKTNTPFLDLDKKSMQPSQNKSPPK